MFHPYSPVQNVQYSHRIIQPNKLAYTHPFIMTTLIVLCKVKVKDIEQASAAVMLYRLIREVNWFEFRQAYR
jgi:hypothetical protein